MWSSNNETLRAWLKFNDDYVVRAHKIMVEDDRHARLQFHLPGTIPDNKNAVALALIVDHPSDGPAVLPDALILTQPDDESQPFTWDKTGITNLNFKKRFAFPYRNILYETIRNTYFHVPLWMAMYALLALATIFNIRYLLTKNEMLEERAFHLTLVALVFGVLGICTGMMWAEFAWGRFWSWDIKQTMSLLAMLMFVAYVFIRVSIPDETARRRFNAVYGIFAFVMIFPLLYIVPRLAPSLHPGSRGNPAFGSDDMDNTMRMVFYPAIVAYTLLGLWLAQLSFRIYKIKHQYLFKK